ncbi:MAG: hypothetical protein AAGE37_10830 [Pseudomonadota bacterium]
MKATLRFGSCEMSHQQLGRKMLERVQTGIKETAKVEAYPKLESRQMLKVICPK